MSLERSGAGQTGFGDPVIDRVYRYWAGRRHDGRLPGRGDIRPEDLADVLRHVFLVDVQRDPFALRYRLIGTHIVDRFGTDPTGKPVQDHFFGNDWSFTEAAYRHAIERKSPNFASGRNIDKYGRSATVNRILLPLAADGETVDMILGCVRCITL